MKLPFKSLKKGLGIVALSSLVLLTAACSSGEEAAKSESDSKETSKEKVYTFSGVTALTENDLLSQAFFLFADKIEKNSDGRIKFEYRGGPETIPPMELGEAVRNGMVDFAVTPAAYYSSSVPEGLALSYSELTTEEELANGAIDYLNQLHNEKLNAQLLGRGAEVKFGLFTKEEITSLEDFKGKRLRGTPTYAPMYKDLGAELVSLPGGEVFEALDKGVVDGFGWTAVGISDLGLEEQVGYKLASGSEYYRMDVVNIMNLDKWNSLSDDLKQIMIETQREVEKELPNVTQSYIEKEAPKLEKAGIKEMNLGDDFAKIVSDAGWKFINQNIENPDKLEELFRK
jgi:TRAP-type transport system periplasmic protein